MNTSLIHFAEIIGYPGIALMVFAETGVFFGFIFPGTSLLFTAGLLSSQGIFNPWILIPLVTVAAIIGDSAGYWFGAKIGFRLFLKPDAVLFKHKYVEQAKDFYDKHGSMAIFFARFLPVVRTFAPIVAGVVKMRYDKFLFYNVLGALGWGAGVTWIGYYLGAKVPFIEHYFTPIIIVIIIVSTLPVLFHMNKKSDVIDGQ